jgi:hypothetical protein
MKKNVLYYLIAGPTVSLRMRILAKPKGYLIFYNLIPIGSFNEYQAELSPVPA